MQLISKLLRKIINNHEKYDYILNDNFNYRNLKCVKLNKPIFLSICELKWIEYYNIINMFDKIYIIKNNIKINQILLNIFNKDKEDVTLCEIENYQGEIIKNKIVLKSSSDTEILLEYFSLFGLEKTLNDINGIFAFAIYDLLKKKLIIARDRFGVKPLYWGKINNSFINFLWIALFL